MAVISQNQLVEIRSACQRTKDNLTRARATSTGDAAFDLALVVAAIAMGVEDLADAVQKFAEEAARG